MGETACIDPVLVSRPGALCVRKKFQSVYAVEAIQATRLPTFTPWPCTRAAAGYLLGARSYRSSKYAEDAFGPPCFAWFWGGCDRSLPRQPEEQLVSQQRPSTSVATQMTTHNQGDINPNLVEPESSTVIIDLSRASDPDLRYFDIVEPAAGEIFAPSSRLVLAARGGHGASNPADETYNMQLVEVDASSTVVIRDRGFAANSFIRRFGDEYYAFGGEFIDDIEDEWQESDPRDGIHVVTSRSLDAIRGGSWLSPEHGYHRVGCCDWGVSKHQLALDGWHGGRIDARGGTNNIMMFDGKLSAVRMSDGHWLLYARANLKEHGGRFVVVARSRTTSAWGDSAYEDFQMLDIAGYDRNGPGNLYFAAVDLHPLDHDMLAGLFPVNMGEEGDGNGNGDSFIGIALSCDGVHWSQITPLVWSAPRDGRTYDHPVDGFLLESGDRVSFLVHRNVKGISPFSTDHSSIVKYQLRTDRLRTLTTHARSTLPGCPAASPPPPTPPSPPLPASPSPPPTFGGPPPPPIPPPSPQPPPPPPWTQPCTDQKMPFKYCTSSRLAKCETDRTVQLRCRQSCGHCPSPPPNSPPPPPPPPLPPSPPGLPSPSPPPPSFPPPKVPLPRQPPPEPPAPLAPPSPQPPPSPPKQPPKPPPPPPSPPAAGLLLLLQSPAALASKSAVVLPGIVVAFGVGALLIGRRLASRCRPARRGAASSLRASDEYDVDDEDPEAADEDVFRL